MMKFSLSFAGLSVSSMFCQFHLGSILSGGAKSEEDAC